MGNCLLTQLKGNVNNPLLEKFGVLKLEVKSVVETSAYYNLLVLSATEPTTIKVVGGGDNDGISETSTGISSPVKEITFSGQKNIYTTNGNYTLEIKDKYKLTKINVNGAGYSSCNIILSDLEWLKSLTNLKVINQTSSGKLSDLSKLEELTDLDVSSSKITGNISDIANLIKLEDFRVSYSNIKGDIDDFATKMVTAGRTTGTLTIYCNIYITWNGVEQTQGKKLYITFNSSAPNGYTISETNPNQ